MHRTSWRLAAVLIAAASLLVSACTGDDDASGDTTAAGDATTPAAGDTAETEAPGTSGASASGDTLAAVQSADVVRCGTRDDLPGFAVLDSAGEHVGFDADFCRVIAAAVLGDATKVEFVDVATDDRFTALQSGEIDVLVRNTTWTATRDGTEGVQFLQPTFYDGQGMMVAADSGYHRPRRTGRRRGLRGGRHHDGGQHRHRVRAARPGPAGGAVLRRRRAVAASVPGGSLRRLVIGPQPAHRVALELPGRAGFPRDPGEDVLQGAAHPGVRDGDSQWAQAVQWAIFATIQAEEFELTQANVDAERDGSTNPSVQAFLGNEIEGAVLDPGLGLPTDFAYQVVKQVGNYGEIYDRHIVPLGLDRGPNALWSDGGLLYAPPYR